MYSEEEKQRKFDDIINDIVENSVSIRKALKGRLSPQLFFDMLKEDTEKAKRYARATEIRADIMAEEILDIADDSSSDIAYNDKGDVIENREFINRSKVRIDARKWLLAKMQPKKYGDKLDLTSDGEKIQYHDPFSTIRQNVGINGETKAGDTVPDR